MHHRKLEDWDSGDEFGPSPEVQEKDTMNKNNRVVVLKHMFTLRQLAEDPTLLLDLKDEVREECSTLGDVTNVVLYDVRFRNRNSNKIYESHTFFTGRT